jgi:MerR family transcriptional regulator, thiopeptide resistance regulator
MERYFQVGELASATGLTVRTLHHYDEVGLLSASTRTDAGYRLYDRDAVRRLYQIVALRQLGLKLEQIKAVFDGEADPMHVVKQHLEAVERALDLQGELRERLIAVLGSLDRSEANNRRLLGSPGGDEQDGAVLHA